MLLNSYRLPSDTDKDMLLRTYLMAVEELPAEAICSAAKRFIRGEVPHQDKRFTPSTAEFAAECRSRKAQMEFEARPKVEEASAKSVKYVPKAWMKALADAFNGRISWAEFAAITGKKVE